MEDPERPGNSRAFAARSDAEKKGLPSRHTTVGPERAPHRSFLYAMGLSAREIAQPFVGVVTTWNEAAPCNIALSRQAQAVKKGVAASGGTPREFTTITVTDGIAMGHAGMKASLVSREVIADSVELSVRGHCYDALVGLAGCDKTLPGLMMAMLRLNVPSVFLYGGSILPGRFRGKDVTVLDVFEAVGAHAAGTMTDADLAELEAVACPSAGSCGGQYTANSMAYVSEAIGLALPGSVSTPAPYESRDRFADAAGRAVMALVKRGLRPRDIVTREALENAAAVVAATGGSTNAALHLPAMANEAGIAFDIFDVAAVFRRTPLIADLKPGGRYLAKDVHEIGGVPVVLKALLDGGFLHGECLTVTGRSLAENLAGVGIPENQDVVMPTTRAMSPTGGLVVLEGNLAPEGAIVKVAGLHILAFSGPARVFDTEEDAFAAVMQKRYQSGEVLWRESGADHRWPLFGCDPRPMRRSRRAGSGGRRPDRADRGWRYDRDRRGARHALGPARSRGDGGAPRAMAAAPACVPVGGAVALRADRRTCRQGRGHPSRSGRRRACLC